MSNWYKRAGNSTDPTFAMSVRPGDPGWSHTGLLVADLKAGESRMVDTGDCEWIVLPLSGGDAIVRTAGQSLTLRGRVDVFSGATDSAYVPRDSQFTVTSSRGGRLALCHAKATRAFPVRLVEAADVPVELRGAGNCSRQVQNFGTPGVLEADSIIACEVITPAGNWSSYPPHKHDTYRPGEETQLEEIYYFELRAEAGAPDTASPFGYQCVYGSQDRPIEIRQEVHTGDVVLVPHGWHGPAMAPPGYDMYYLNVMAGPGPVRAWLISDDPSHSWVRECWASQDLDPRLPL